MNAYELADAIEDWDSDGQWDTPAAVMLRQQADRIAELEKDLVLKTRDRDVFCNFTLAYEKRIEELEKQTELLQAKLNYMFEQELKSARVNR